MDNTTAVSALRILSVDMVEAASSGHPGLPLGCAPVAYVIYRDFLRHDPSTPDWPDRDRFVLSAGHGSALLYALLHLSGYERPSMDDLRLFRQLGSPTAGHPEIGVLPGVETTTGPLGQGFANGVGMAIAERHLAARFNVDGRDVVNHWTYGIVSDGDLMEGVSYEAASLAGHLQLGRLVYLYDDNRITIDGPTNITFSESVCGRFQAMGWHTDEVDDPENLNLLRDAICRAREDPRPSLIRVRTTIGYGAPGKAGQPSAHGSPLGAVEVDGLRAALGWEYEPFDIPQHIYDHMDARPRGEDLVARWQQDVSDLRRDHPALAEAFDRPHEDRDQSPHLVAEPAARATRQHSATVLRQLSASLPTLIGGSADLSGSNGTDIPGETDFTATSRDGRVLRFGIREHGMGAITNGIASHGGLLPYAATFLVFSDYLRPAIRLAALGGLRTIWVFTHDSVAVGEDGPTHQPIEHLASLRAIPGLAVARPADGLEVAVAWRRAVDDARPTALILSRQELPDLGSRSDGIVRRGGYVLHEPDAPPVATLVATGSEVSLALGASERLRKGGVQVRVVSMPCVEWFEEQPEEYREAVLPPELPTLAIEAGATAPWHQWVGSCGSVLGIDRFGMSGPGNHVLQALGLTAENAERAVRRLIGLDL